MKRTFHLVAAILVVVTVLGGFATPQPVEAAPTDLFFSEYVEGSGKNQALEIYNGTGSPVNLAAGGYKVWVLHNQENCNVSHEFLLKGTVASGGVFVLAHALADAGILAHADQTVYGDWFDGDDEVILSKSTGSLDIIGSLCQGMEWGTGLTSPKDHTLRRKGSIEAGDINSMDLFDPAVEWDGYPMDTFNGLGYHHLGAALDHFIYVPATIKGGDPSIPFLVAPKNGSAVGNLIPRFIFNSGTQPPNTGICVYSGWAAHPTSCLRYFDLNYSGPVIDWMITENLSEGATIFWRIGVIYNQDFNNPKYSQEWSFSTPTAGTFLDGPALLSPTNGSEVPSSPMTLTWQPSEGAVQYFAYFQPIEGNIAFRQGPTTNTYVNVSISSLIRNYGTGTTYKWWVSARNDYAWGPDSAKWQFTYTGPIPPP